MVATLAQMASAAYYLESQRSFRHPNEYYTAGEEPDGVWWNPSGLFELADGGRVDGGEFHRLYHGFAPDGGERLTRNAGSEKRSPGLDMTFSADKSVSALWAIADPELRSEIESAHNDAARAALAGTVLRYCAWTRLQERDGTRVVAADIMGAMFQHGTSRENDPQLHTHCTIFNAARTHRDGKYRALHQHPVYAWMKAAGAVYRNALAWNLRDRLGIRMEQYGKDNEFTRIAGFAPSDGTAGQEPSALLAHWSKRRVQIVEAAREMGFTVEGNAPRAAAANKITRAGKSPDNDPEIRHARWCGEAEGYVERESLIASLLGNAEEITQERIRALTEVLEDLPYRLTREEAVFRLPDIVERVGNAAAGLLNRGRGDNQHRACASEPGGGAPEPPAAVGRGPGRYGAHEALFDPPHPADGAGRQGYGGRHGRRYGTRPVRAGHRGKGGGAAEGGLSAERRTDRSDPVGHFIRWPGRHHRRSGGIGQDHDIAPYRRSLP